MTLRWLLLAGLVILCRGFAAVGGGCEDADDTTVMQAAREMGLGDVMSCSDVAIQGHCSHPQAKEGCCKTCNRGRLLGGQPSCQGAGSRSFMSENCGVGSCSQTGKDEPCEPYGPCCDHEGYKCVHRDHDCTQTCGSWGCSFTCTDWYGCNFIDHPSPPPSPPPLPPPLEVVKPHIVASTQSCPLGQSCSPITWTELPDTDVAEGTCDPNPNPTGTVTKVCPLGSLELAPSGDISGSRPTLYKGNLACVAPKDGTQCDFRHPQDGTPDAGAPDYTPCSVSYTCSHESPHGDDKYHHQPLQDCPRGTWSCVAYNGEDADGPDGVLKHSTVGSDPGKQDRAAVPCWFPSLSPLGLQLEGRKTKPAAQPDLVEQCKHPPFVFAYDDPGPVSRTPERPGVLPSTPTTFSCLKIAGDDETDIAPPEYSTFPQTDIATPCDPAGGDTSLGSCNDDNDCQAKCDIDENCLGYSVEAVRRGAPVTVNIGSSSSNSKTKDVGLSGLQCPETVNRDNWLGTDTYDDTFAISQEGTTVTARRTDSNSGWGLQLQFVCDSPDSVAADTNVVGDCSSAPGGNSDLGICSSQADCEAQCNSNAECLGYVDMTAKNRGYMLKNYVGPDCVETRSGFVLHVPVQESFALKKYLGPACVEHKPAARIRAKPAAVEPKRGFLIDQTLGTLQEWNRQCGETFWSQGTYDWMALEAGISGCVGDVCRTDPEAKAGACDIPGAPGCEFSMARYLPFFSYAIQLRLVDVAKGSQMYTFPEDSALDVTGATQDVGVVSILQTKNLQATASVIDTFVDTAKWEASSSSSRRTLFAPFMDDPMPPPTSPCDKGFVPTCEHAKDFGLCHFGKEACPESCVAEVLHACPETCALPRNVTQGPGLWDETSELFPADYDTPVPEAAKAAICDACSAYPGLKCCHNHPHVDRRRLTTGIGSCDSHMIESSFGTALLQAQSAHAMNIATLTGGSTMESNSGFIPSFSYKFYVTEMGNYVNALTRLQTALEKQVEKETELQLYIAQLRIEQAKLSGKESVTARTQEMTMKTITTAITGMDAAMKGIKSIGGQMNDTMVQMKKDIDAWIVEQQVKAIMDLCVTLCSFALSGAGAAFELKADGAGIGAKFPWGGKKEGSGWEAPNVDLLGLGGFQDPTPPKRSWAGKEASYNGASHVTKGIGIFINGAVSIFEASKAVSKANGLSSDVRDAAGLSVKAMEEQFDWPSNVSLIPSSNDSLADLSTLAFMLNDLLPKLGTGYWSEIYANSGDMIEPYTTGYNTEINVAAKKWLKQMRAQCDYGNDYVTHGVRFVAGVQQALINLAQEDANKKVEKAIEDAFGISSEANFDTWAAEKKLLIGTQMSTMALQLFVTTRQLCQSFAYQTTQLFQQCVVGSIGVKSLNNPLDELCGAFSNGTAYFKPFEYDVVAGASYGDLDGFTKEAKDYVEGLQTMFSQATAVKECVTKAVWGKGTSAINRPFLSLIIRPENLPPCNGTDGYVRTGEPVVCSIDSDAKSNGAPYPTGPDDGPLIEFWHNDSCLPNASAAPLSSGETCCQTIAWTNNCTRDPPESKQPFIYVSDDAWATFKDTSDAATFGRLNIEIRPDMVVPGTKDYNDLLLRGFAFYMPGAVFEEGETAIATLTPNGQMQQRVYDKDRAPVCRDFGNQNLCMYRNFTFVASPTDGEPVEDDETTQVVLYSMSYYNPNSWGTCRRLMSQPVFYADRAVTGPTCDPPSEDEKACYQYCTDQDLSSLEDGNIRSVYVDSAGPFNFAALFTSYVLEVGARGVDRLSGVDLTNVEQIELGLWLKSHTTIDAPLSCDMRNC